MLIRFALLLVSIPLLVHGGDGLYHALRSRSQVAVACDAFTANRPSSHWVRITGCDVDYLRAGYHESGGQIRELFLPLTPPAVPANQPVSLVVATSDPAVLESAASAVRGAEAGDQNAYLAAMLEVVTTMGAAREVQGMVRSPLEMFRSRRALAALNAPLADDAVVVDLDRRPSVLLPAIELALVALIALILMGLSLRRRQQPETIDQRIDASVGGDPVEAAAFARPMAPVPASVPAATEFRRLMLVNLPPSAAPSALEQATPLGTQASVRAALTQVLPGIIFTEQGVGEFVRPDHTIVLNLGTKPQVWTAALDVTGETAPEALKRLITETGWRAYAPRLGRFITSADLRRGH